MQIIFLASVKIFVTMVARQPSNLYTHHIMRVVRFYKPISMQQTGVWEGAIGVHHFFTLQKHE